MIVGLLALLLMAAPAGAYYQIKGIIHMPPRMYDHYPTEPFTVEFWPQGDLRILCRNKYPPGLQIACTREDRIIIVRDDLSPAAVQLVLRHEYGHLNGWLHEEPTTAQTLNE